jgi:hypothetical protein
MTTFALPGSAFSLSEDKDQSSMGVELRWLDCKGIQEEAIKFYPGIAALKLHYLPVGSCLEGSGDPYFLLMDGSMDPELVRIPHDAIDEHDLNENCIELVCEHLSSFFNKAECG